MIKVGQRVHCILYGGEDGTVVAIHGEQRPETVKRLASIMVMGGSAEFDIIWDNGSTSHRIPEAILHGVQWRIYDEVVSPEAAAEEQARAYQAEKARILEAYPYLQAAGPEVYHGSKLAAQNLRTELKRAFKGVKFSVRIRRGVSSVDVQWTDGPTKEQVEAFAMKYNRGHFDGMTDCFESTPTPWTDTFGGADYVCCDREYSDEALVMALDKVYERLDGNLQDVPKPDLGTLRGYGMSQQIPNLRWTLRDAVNLVLVAWDGLNKVFAVPKTGHNLYDVRFLLGEV